MSGKKDSSIKRRKLLFGSIDIIDVFDESQMKIIEELPEVKRPGDDDRNTPWVARHFLKYSIFRLGSKKTYSLPMATEDSGRHQKIRQQFTPNWLQMESEMLHEALFEPKNEPLAVERALAMIWASRSLKQEAIEADNGVPDAMLKYALLPLTSFAAALDPRKIFAAWQAKQKLEKYFSSRIKDEVLLQDAIHNFCALLQAAAPVLRKTASSVANKQEFEEKFKNNLLDSPIITQVLRVVDSESKLAGLIEKNAKPRKTMIVMHIGKVATENRDDAYVFGPNSATRQCPFQPLLYKMTKTISQST